MSPRNLILNDLLLGHRIAIVDRQACCFCYSGVAMLRVDSGNSIEGHMMMVTLLLYLRTCHLTTSLSPKITSIESSCSGRACK
jgi:hypothetical protein